MTRRGKTLAGLRGGGAWRRRCNRNAVVRREKLAPTVGAHIRLQVIRDGLKVPVPCRDHCGVKEMVHCARCHRVRRGLRQKGIHREYGDSEDPQVPIGLLHPLSVLLPEAKAHVIHGVDHGELVEVAAELCHMGKELEPLIAELICVGKLVKVIPVPHNETKLVLRPKGTFLWADNSVSDLHAEVTKGRASLRNNAEA